MCMELVIATSQACGRVRTKSAELNRQDKAFERLMAKRSSWQVQEQRERELAKYAAERDDAISRARTTEDSARDNKEILLQSQA